MLVICYVSSKLVAKTRVTIDLRGNVITTWKLAERAYPVSKFMEWDGTNFWNPIIHPFADIMCMRMG